jgi:hypothetical protein
MSQSIINRISKTLSANDTGETGGHQAGILIPKNPKILSFFPALEAREKNPRITLVFRDTDGVTKWSFVFIYYNNRFFGGTRNEYRLTGMTRFIISKNLKSGSEMIFEKDELGRLFILSSVQLPKTSSEDDSFVLKLSSGWKVLKIKG